MYEVSVDVEQDGTILFLINNMILEHLVVQRTRRRDGSRHSRQ